LSREFVAIRQSGETAPVFFAEALGRIDGGRVLDVACGAGAFTNVLAESLHQYDAIVGVDSYEPAIVRARDRNTHANVEYQVMDGRRLAYADDSFDTVSVSGSLHHFEDVEEVLGELRRVPRPGGLLILFEHHADAPTRASETRLRFHSWMAEIDRSLGIFHGPILTRGDLVDLLRSLRPRDLVIHDWCDTSRDPDAPEVVDALSEMIESQFRRLGAEEDNEDLRQRGHDLRKRLRETGCHPQPFLLALARLP